MTKSFVGRTGKLVQQKQPTTMHDGLPLPWPSYGTKITDLSSAQIARTLIKAGVPVTHSMGRTEMLSVYSRFLDGLSQTAAGAALARFTKGPSST